MINDLVTIYQWGGALCFLLGLVLAVVGLVTGECRFIGASKFGDSAVTRVTTGVGIGMIWPLFLVFLLVDALSNRSKKKGSE